MLRGEKHEAHHKRHIHPVALDEKVGNMVPSEVTHKRHHYSHPSKGEDIGEQMTGAEVHHKRHAHPAAVNVNGGAEAIHHKHHRPVVVTDEGAHVGSRKRISDVEGLPHSGVRSATHKRVKVSATPKPKLPIIATIAEKSLETDGDIVNIDYWKIPSCVKKPVFCIFFF